MISLTKIQVIKLKSYKSFWLFFLSHLTLFILVALIFRRLASGLNINGQAAALEQMFSFSNIWVALIWIGRWFYLFPGLFMISLITVDFENRTLRQHILDGLSRARYLMGNYLLILYQVLFACILVTVLAFTLSSGGESDWRGPFKNLTVFFLQGMFYLSFAMMLGLFIKRTAVAMLTFLIWPIFVEPIMSWGLKFLFNVQYGRYFPFAALSGIAPSLTNLFSQTQETEPVLSLLSFAYVLLVGFVSFYRLEKMDL